MLQRNNSLDRRGKQPYVAMHNKRKVHWPPLFGITGEKP